MTRNDTKNDNSYNNINKTNHKNKQHNNNNDSNKPAAAGRRRRAHEAEPAPAGPAAGELPEGRHAEERPARAPGAADAHDGTLLQEALEVAARRLQPAHAGAPGQLLHGGEVGGAQLPDLQPDGLRGPRGARRASRRADPTPLEAAIGACRRPPRRARPRPMPAPEAGHRLLCAARHRRSPAQTSMKHRGAPEEKCPQCLSLWGPLGDTPPIRNKTLLGPT